MSSSLSGTNSGDGDVLTPAPAGLSSEEGTRGTESVIPLRILIADDDRTLLESCASILEIQGHEVTLSARGQEALDILRRRRFDLALIDLYMLDVSGMELLRASLKANPDLIPIIITGKPSVDSNMEAIRAGAWDYLPKPFSATQLQVMIGRAAHAVLGARKTQALQQDIETQHGHSEKVKVLGISPAFQRIVEVCRRVAPTDASAFVTGESGTGKELIAQFIHHHSRRARKPLVPINCAALPETLLESEMFGHCKGSFTGAVRDKPGLLEIADGGTMFLDEITEMSQAIQAKLLRVIQDGVVRRVGSTKTDAVVNVRFIAATNRDPEEAVESGTLRQDLYFRLRVVPIRVPPLRERPEDVPILAEHFLLTYWKRHRERGAEPPKFTAAATRALQDRQWPGNVRELQNAIEHAVVFLEPGADIKAEDVPSVQDKVPAQEGSLFELNWLDEPYHIARDRMTAEFERRYLVWVVNRAAGNMSKAARIAGIDRTTIYRLMEKHGLRRDAMVAQNSQDTP
jgi:DNA-binding NtrC family response regulator